MTRKEKIAILKDIIEGEIVHPQIRKNVGMWAIEELEQEGCTDTISRQEALNAVTFSEVRWQAIERIKQLPFVKSQEPTGDWIKDNQGNWYFVWNK